VHVVAGLSLVKERTIRFDDGAETTLQTWGDAGPLLLCVHGMTSSRRSWERLAKRFAGTYRVAAYDQRGHGDSASVTGPMSLARGVRDLQAVAHALGPVSAYVGHSWGGAVAVRAGLASDVARVAAIDPMIRQAGDAWYDEYLAELAESFSAVGDERDRRTREEYADWAPEDIEGKVHAVHAMTTAPIAGLRLENTADDWDLRAEIARYDRPLLLALADRDASINDRETFDALESGLPPCVNVAIFAGQGHNLHRTDFDRFASVLAAFLHT
jgi:pimeloyl-ACP methyl ester carboxylesterase